MGPGPVRMLGLRDLVCVCVQGALCTGSGRFKHSEPPRTFSNYILTELARYIEFFYTSSGWFDWTEPSLPASLQGIEVLYALVG